MTGETGMSLAVAGRKRQMVQTACHLAECSRKWKLQQETSDGRLLTYGTAGRAAAAWTTTADGDDLAGYRYRNELVQMSSMHCVVHHIISLLKSIELLLWQFRLTENVGDKAKLNFVARMKLQLNWTNGRRNSMWQRQQQLWIVTEQQLRPGSLWRYKLINPLYTVSQKSSTLHLAP